jgi:hypothetical protein
MYSPTIEAPISTRGAVLSLALLAASFTAAEEPVPTPTPRPGTLAAYASRTPLDRTTADEETGRVTVTSENLKELAEGGRITLGAPLGGGPASRKTSAGPTDRERERWQDRYKKQRDVIAKLETRRSKLEVEIDHIKDGKLDVRNLARLDRAEAKLDLLDGEIRREQAALARIVRDARQHGAQPGWFR